MNRTIVSLKWIVALRRAAKERALKQLNLPTLEGAGRWTESIDAAHQACYSTERTNTEVLHLRPVQSWRATCRDFSNRPPIRCRFLFSLGGEKAKANLARPQEQVLDSLHQLRTKHIGEYDDSGHY